MITAYCSGILQINTAPHGDGWIAWLEDNPGIWEAGATEEIAIGKLVITTFKSDRISEVA